MCAGLQPPVDWLNLSRERQTKNFSKLEVPDTDVAIKGEDGRRTIELITAIYKSGATHQSVELPLQKDDPFYTVEGIMASVPHFYEKTTSAVDLDGGPITLGSDYKK